MSRQKIRISILILLVIGLHAVPLVYRAERKTLWPFLQWSMYKNAADRNGVQANKRHVFGVTARGEEVAVTPELVGLSVTVVDERYVVPMWRGDSAAARALIARLNRGRADSIVALRIESETWAVTDSGLVRHENPARTFAAGAARAGTRPAP
jgi:hypothetical protein